MGEAGRREREYSKGRREMWCTEGGVREKDARTEPRGGEGRGTSSLIAKGSSRTVGRDAEEKRGEDGRVDYLRLIWIVDYSGPRGAAWPRVSISEPLARAHLRLPLLLCLRSSRTRPALPNLSRASTPFPPASYSSPPPPYPVSPSFPDRLLASSSRFLLAEKFVRSD